MNEQQLREALEACRPGTDDLHAPELSELAELVDRDPRWQAVWARTQQRDAAIRQAFGEVPVPAGLCERLLAAVAASDAPAPTVMPAQSAATNGSAANAATRRSRGWRLPALVLTSVTVAIALLVLLGRPSGRLPELNDEFSREVISWTDQLQQSDWNDDLGAAVYPLDQAIRATPRRWTQVATAYDRQTLVYDLSGPGREFAFAFCIPLRGRASGLPALPPAVPFSTTGGVAVGAWQSQELVYVLAIQGGQNRYQAFLKSGLLLGCWRP